MSLIGELKRRNVIRVAVGYIVSAWLVVQVVETVFPAFGFGDEAVRFVVLAFAVGFIPVVILAWVFEWTPQGLKKDEGVSHPGPVVAAAAKRWDRIVMIILAAAVTFFVVERILEPPTDVESAIAVLPFEGSSSVTDAEFLSTAVARGVHTSLARIAELVVSAWPAAVELRRDGLAAVEIAKKLRAPNFLTGTVDTVGDRIRITANLVVTDSGRTIWTETYDGAMSDVFDIQDEIAAAIVSSLKVGPSSVLSKAQRTNPQTYQLTVQAWSMLNRLDQENATTISAELLDKALALDPDYVSALNALSFLTFQQEMTGAVSRDEAAMIYRDVQERILAIDPDNGVANAYLAWELVWDRSEFAHANQHLQIALRTGLNDLEVLRTLAGFARRTGHSDVAIRVGQRAMEVDPTCENCQWQQSENLFYAGRFAEAIEAKSRVRMLGGGAYHHAIMLIANREPDAALEVIDESGSADQVAAIRAMAYHLLNDAERSEENVSALKRMEGFGARLSLAQFYAFTGDADPAFEVLESLAGMGNRLKSQLFLPQWENLRNDPRWLELRARLDMTEKNLSALDFSSLH